MTKLHADFEVRSTVDLKMVGIDVYAKHPTTEILLLAYAFGNGTPKIWEKHLGDPPQDLIDGLKNPSVTKVAWNAGYERNIFLRKMGIWIPYEQWEDPMVNARYLSLPGGLEDVGDILDLPLGLRKIADGKRLIKLFCEPQTVRKSRKQATDDDVLFDISPLVCGPVYKFNDHLTHPEDWKKFVEYCKQDIVAERALGERLAHFALPEREKRLWYLDQKINDRGFYTFRNFVECSYELAVCDKDKQLARQKELTQLENPNSSTQMLAWARAQGYPYNSLRKEPVSVALNDPAVRLTPLGREVLTLRKQSGKTSYTKLAAILSALSDDDYLRDQFLFMGSARAGRWSGKQVQMHNMARPVKAIEEDGALEKARDLILAKDFDGIVKTFTTKDKKTGKEIPGSVIEIVTSCIRSSFGAPEGKRLNVCDLNAIENRVLGWVGGEDKILEVFRQKRCPYLSFASIMYGIPYEVLYAAYKRKDPDAKEKRQVAKPAVLGAGYRLSGGDWYINRYGDRVKGGLWGYAENMGISISKELSHESVRAFRAEYARVVQSWYDTERAVIRCLKGQGPQDMVEAGPRDANGVSLIRCHLRKRKSGKNVLYIQLPSGRRLHYVDAQVIVEPAVRRDGTTYEKELMAYQGINQETRQWELIRTHGGKLIENIVQAISRDVLANAMMLADDLGFEIVAHVHDEIVTMSPDVDDSLGLQDLQWCMSVTPDWAPGLPLAAEGYEGHFYKKG